MEFIGIQNIKNQNLICLDFDDCIVPWNEFLPPYNSYSEEYILKETRKNVNYIKEMCDKYNFKAFITSSWTKVLDENYNLDIEIVRREIYFELLNIIKELPLIGKDPFNDRNVAIDVLLENGNIVVAIDDLDLSLFHNEDNFYFLNVLNGKNLNKLEDILKELNGK